MWFSKEVLYNKFGTSLLWILFLQKCFIDIFLLFIKLASWHPLLGVQDWVSHLFSWRAMYYHFILSLTCATFAVLHMHFYAVEKHIFSTRLEAVGNFISPSRLIHLFSLSTLGALSTYSLLGIIGGVPDIGQHKSFIESCFLLEKPHNFIFVILHGVHAGALFSCKYFSSDWYLLKFSLVQQTKFCEMKCKLPEILIESVRHVMRPLHWYYIMYIMFGSCLSHWILTLFNIQTNSSLSETLYNLISFNLLLATVGTAAILYFTWIVYIYVFNVFATERFEFMIDSSIEENKKKILCKSLTCTDLKLLKYLAFLDLRWLVQFSPERRKKFFTISQPGGHPHQWQGMSNICLCLLTEFLSQLNHLSHAGNYNGKKPASLPVEKAKDVVIESPIAATMEKFKDYFMKKRIVCYFLDELPGAKALKIFTSCQLEIWTIEALALFVAASYTEDKYGVVQRSLPQIICLLIDIKLCEEKLPIGTIGVKKYGKDSKSLNKVFFSRHAIKSAVESALYRIVLTFKTDVRGVCVPDEYRRYLERYLEFKE